MLKLILKHRQSLVLRPRFYCSAEADQKIQKLMQRAVAANRCIDIIINKGMHIKSFEEEEQEKGIKRGFEHKNSSSDTPLSDILSSLHVEDLKDFVEKTQNKSIKKETNKE